MKILFIKPLILNLILSFFSTSVFAQTQIGTTIPGQLATDSFGGQVSLSDDGEIVAIGAYGYNAELGLVQVFENVGGIWTQIGADLSGSMSGDRFGFSVSLSANGDYLAIGAPGSSSSVGLVQIYENIAGSWTKVGADLNGSIANDGFGVSVSLSDDGSIIAIGANGFSSNSGLVQIYENDGGTWTQIGTDLTGPASSEFGTSISLSSNGSIVAVGAIRDNSDTGLVQIFQNVGGVWTQLGLDLTGTGTGDNFGIAISLSDDGSILGIGAIGYSTNGLVQVYENVGGTWTQLGSDLEGVTSGGQFGTSVNVSSDGNIIVIGENFANTITGLVQIYENVNGSWTQVGVDIAGTATLDLFGSAVSLGADPYALAIGAPGTFSGRAGYVKVYELPISPKVSTGVVGVTGTSTADVASNVMSSGGSAVTVRGVCWSTTSNPTTANDTTTDGAGTGAFFSSLTGLTQNTTYYLRAYATNANGTSYGDERTFTTDHAYLTWTGNTSSDWSAASNWDPQIAPNLLENVLIPDVTTDPVISNTPDSPAGCFDLTINPGAGLSINAGAALTVLGDFHNDGELHVLSPTNSGPTGSLIVLDNDDISGVGMEYFYRWVSASSLGETDFSWHNVGVPLGPSSGPTFNAGDYFLNDYVIRYQEGTNAWLNIEDENATIFSGVGFLLKTVNGDKTYAFSGRIVHYEQSFVDLANSSVSNLNGYHLISNPYTSPIDLDQLDAQPTMSNTFWLWDGTNYRMRQSGTGDLGQYILPGQAFFVKVADDQATGTFNFLTASKTHLNGGATFLRTSNQEESIVLKVSNDKWDDNLFINMRDVTNTGYKFLSMNPEVPQLYAKVDDKSFGIYNIREMKDEITIPLEFKSTFNGTFTIDVSSLQLEGYDVMLIDKLESKVHKLERGVSITIDHKATNVPERFDMVLRLSAVTSLEDFKVANDLDVYNLPNGIFIKSPDDQTLKYTLFNINGAKLNDGFVQNNSFLAMDRGIYIINVVQGDKMARKKIIIR